MSAADEVRQEDALADVDHSAAIGVLMSVLAGAAFVALLMFVGRRVAFIAIPLVFAAVAFVVARPKRRHRDE